jgi:hypothetical protein
MTKVLVGDLGSYTFNATAGTVTLTGLPTLSIEQVLVITNVKDSANDVIYQFDLNSRGGTISGNVITLVYDTTSMADTDPLQIWIDLPTFYLLSEDILTSNGANVVKAVMSGYDSSNNKFVNLNSTSSKRLLVSNETPPAGPGETQVSRALRGDYSGTTDNLYTIPNNTILQIRSFTGGIENTGAGFNATLFEDVNGDLSVLNPVPEADIIIDGNTRQINLTYEISGDGTKRLLMRFEQLTGGSYRTTVAWSGVLI